MTPLCALALSRHWSAFTELMVTWSRLGRQSLLLLGRGYKTLIVRGQLHPAPVSSTPLADDATNKTQKRRPSQALPSIILKTRDPRSNRLTSPDYEVKDQPARTRFCRSVSVGFRQAAGEGSRREYGRDCESPGTLQERVEGASVPWACGARIFGGGCDARRSGFSPRIG